MLYHFHPRAIEAFRDINTFENREEFINWLTRVAINDIYVSLRIQILLMVFTTRCFLQILIITHNNGDMSNFVRVGIFNLGLCVNDLGC